MQSPSCTTGLYNRCMNTTGCTTGWVNYMQMSAAKRRLSGPARTLMTSLGRRAQQGGCVCGAFDRNLKIWEFLFIYSFLFLFLLWSCGMTKIWSITKLFKTLLYLFICLLHEYSKRFVQSVVQPAGKCRRTLSETVHLSAGIPNSVILSVGMRSVVFFSRPRSEGWPHHGRTFSIYPCPL